MRWWNKNCYRYGVSLLHNGYLVSKGANVHSKGVFWNIHLSGFFCKSKEDHSIRRRNSSDLNSFLEIFTIKYKQTLWWLWYSQFRVLLLSREHLWLAVGRLGKWFLVSNCFLHTFHFVSSAQRQSHIFDSLLVKVEKQFPPLRWWPIIVCSCKLGWHASLNMSNFTNVGATALVV